jgi:MYXO-CTERM domain-containing protein
MFRKFALVGAAFAVLISLQRHAWSAGFVGTTVSVGHFLPMEDKAFDGPYDVMVTGADADGGSADRTMLSPFAGCQPGYGVSVFADSVVVDFVADVAFTAGNPFHGLIIQNLVRGGATASITETSPHTTFSYDGATLKLDWQGLSVPAGAKYTIAFTAGNGTGATETVVCSAGPLGMCTACDRGPAPLCQGVDAGTMPFCPDAGVAPTGAAGTNGAGGAGGTAGAAGADGAAGVTGAAGSTGNADASGMAGSGGAGGSKSGSGCSCATAPSERSSAFVLAAGLLALATIIFRRRRRPR